RVRGREITMPKRVQEASVTVAVIQMEPLFGATSRNVERSIALIDQAAAKGAELAVLPELCNTGYVFQSRAEARSLAEEIPDGPSTRGCMEVAARHGLHIVAG